MRHTTENDGKELRIRIRALERENADLQRRLRQLEASARPRRLGSP